ncbi:hypothetical protein [Methylobacterium sp. J-078]|uniref:hypothetical protein n=1 Tax=Methylobacterium sp. J-078 TaxID=2836657 RepID=UPI0039194256
MIGAVRLLGAGQHVHGGRVGADHLNCQHGLVLVLGLNPGNGGNPGVHLVGGGQLLAMVPHDVANVGSGTAGELLGHGPEGGPFLSHEAAGVVVRDLDLDVAPFHPRYLVGEGLGPALAVGDGLVYRRRLLLRRRTLPRF